MQRSARIEGRPVAVAAALARLGRQRLTVAAVRERLELRGNTAITGSQLPMLELVALQRLLEGKQVLGAPGAIEGMGDGSRVLLAPRIPSLRQLVRVTFSRQDRLDDGQARHASNVTDHVLQLDMHLREGLLHVLDATGSIGQQGSPLP